MQTFPLFSTEVVARPALRPRSEVPASDQWNLSKLYGDEAAWDTDLARYRELRARIPSFKGTLAGSAECLAAAFAFLRDLGLLEERLGCYAALRESEDQGLSASRDRTARFMMAQAEARASWSYFDPEIHAIPDERMAEYLRHPVLAEFAVFLRKLLRFKPHVLSEKEERLLAMQIEANQTASNAFSVLLRAV
jgi:oligoendopeptidase F